MMKKHKPALFEFKPFSTKQLKVLMWWQDASPFKDNDGIICDGSVRAGKTVVMSLSYIIWAMETFNEENLGMSGKTIGALRRNVITPLKRMLKSRKYHVKDHRAENYLSISFRGKTNYFYIFGGKDESSQDLIQGITLAGMFFDEVVLMPESFVNQATARCSIEGSKMWYNCNPAGPHHWFKRKVLDELDKNNLLHLHFTMDDNLSLSEPIKERYRRMYSGVFYQRYILGLWVLAEGVIYDMFSEVTHSVPTKKRWYSEYYVSIDRGTQNPTVFGLWGKSTGVWYKIKEYHHEGRTAFKQKTDVQYADDLIKFIGNRKVNGVIVDPSAASFIAEIRNRGLYVILGKNDVAEGIGNVANALTRKLILYNDCCKETFREFSSYSWDKKASDKGKEKPIKENDHHLDADRYFVNTILFGQTDAKAVPSIY